VKYRLCVVAIILTLNAVFPANAQSGASTGVFKYAYVTLNTDTRPITTVTIKVVDPTNPGKADAILTLSVPNYEHPYYLSFRKAITSPDGKWIALIFWAVGPGWGAAQITVVNIATGEAHNVSEFPIILYDDDQTTLERVKLAMWSPDSRFLVFGVLLADGQVIKGGAGLWPANAKTFGNAQFLYAVESHELTNLSEYNNLEIWSTWLAWSGDSKQLAIATQTPTAVADEYQFTIDIYDIAASKQTKSLPIPKRSQWSHLPLALCLLAWPPDGLHLSFVMDCDGGSFKYKDVYIADIETGKIEQLTSYGSDLVVQGDDIGSSYPEPVWYDANTLLVGAGLWQGYGALTHKQETVAYQWPPNRPIVVAQEWATNWSLNPVSKEVAYLTERLDTDKSSINGSFAFESLKIGIFDRRTLTPRISLPATRGNLRWSPDGSILAYSCTVTPVLETTFIDKSSGRITRYTPPADQHTNTFDAGWILVPEKPPSSHD
jgi:hypothetical protein